MGLTGRSALLGLLWAVGSAAANPALNQHAPFLTKYCVDCHGPDKQKGDLRFDTLDTDLSALLTLETWQGIVDQLNLGEMPPPKKPQPSPAEATALVESVSSALEKAYAARRSTGGRAVIRRLNKFELRNTLRDLFHLNHPDFHPTVVSGLYDFNGNGITAHKTIEPTRSFQDDEAAEGLDTIGDTLVMSDFLLRGVIEAAEESIDLATATNPRPEFTARTFTAPINTRVLGGDSLGKFQRAKGDPYDTIFQRWDRYNRIGPDTTIGGLKSPGFYRLTVELSAHAEAPGWGDWSVKEGGLIHRGRNAADEPFRVGLHLERYEHKRGPRTNQVAEWDLPGDGVTRRFTAETWIDHTWAPWVGWENGPWFRHNAFHVLLAQWYPEEWAKIERKNNKQFKQQVADALFRRGYRGPTVRVHSFRIEPVEGDWPPRSHTTLYGAGAIEQADPSALFRTFAQRAYRRPVAPKEVAPYVALAKRLENEGHSRIEAMQGAYTAMLCSPDFLYLRQQGDSLTDFELAARLSYFLWSSMPDAPLFELARAGTLSDPKELERQVERMLQDPRAEAFVRHFTERWLRLYELGSMEPDKKGPYGHYFRVKEDLQPQVDAYFADVLHRNAPIRELIDSDYTFLNGRLAELIYKRPLQGETLRKVAIADRHRGGLLTMPAVMTVTSNGVETNPIRRGVYILENFLGTPPSPPPPDVEPLSPDLRGAKTLKEQFALHRQQESCNRCHHKIDPMGFPLEQFDPIGRWRDHYPPGNKQATPVDPSAVLHDGTEIRGIDDLKTLILDREEQFARCLTEKMLSYASGRLMEAGDRGEIDHIINNLDAKGNRLRDLVHLVIQSPIFLEP